MQSFWGQSTPPPLLLPHCLLAMRSCLSDDWHSWHGEYCDNSAIKDLTSSKTSYLWNMYLSFSWCRILFIFKLKILSWKAGVVFFPLHGNYAQIPTRLSNYAHLWHFRQWFWGWESSLNEWQLVSLLPLYFKEAFQPLFSPSDPLFFIFGSSWWQGYHLSCSL